MWGFRIEVITKMQSSKDPPPLLYFFDFELNYSDFIGRFQIGLLPSGVILRIFSSSFLLLFTRLRILNAYTCSIAGMNFRKLMLESGKF